jgi:hypothetical protein
MYCSVFYLCLYEAYAHRNICLNERFACLNVRIFLIAKQVSKQTIFPYHFFLWLEYNRQHYDFSTTTLGTILHYDYIVCCTICWGLLDLAPSVLGGLATDVFG